jgi:hypothetical protein
VERFTAGTLKRSGRRRRHAALTLCDAPRVPYGRLKARSLAC